ncbi:MAG: DUF1064 domain-containing protein [Bacilli bacterium]
MTTAAYRMPNLLRQSAHKYHAKVTEVDGQRFASKMEAEYYAHLLILQKAGEVDTFTTQPKFELQPAYTDAAGKKVRPIHYVADFLVRYSDGSEKVIDVKGVKTPEFRLKQKMFGFVHPFDRLVCVSKRKGVWVEWV